jgi:hypothetical protein
MTIRPGGHRERRLRTQCARDRFRQEYIRELEHVARERLEFALHMLLERARHPKTVRRAPARDRRRGAAE